MTRAVRAAGSRSCVCFLTSASGQGDWKRRAVRIQSVSMSSLLSPSWRKRRP